MQKPSLRRHQPASNGAGPLLTLIHILVSVIHAILQVIASVLVSGIGLLATALTIVLIAAALGAGGFSGLEAFHHIRKREKAPPKPDDPA
jgi:hypothetical protein